MARFVIKERKDNDYDFRLIADNGEIIAVSEGYASEAGAKRGVDAVKRAVSQIVADGVATDVER